MSHRGRHEADDFLLQALALGMPITNAAKAAGISARTAHRRLKDPVFAERVRNKRLELFERTADLLSAAALESTKEVLAMTKDHSLPAATRLAAARTLLDHNGKYRLSSDMMGRVANLEAELRQARRKSTEEEIA